MIEHECDHCEDLAQTDDEELPEGWLELTIEDSEGDEINAALCSWECVSDFIAQLCEDEESE